MDDRFRGRSGDAGRSVDDVSRMRSGDNIASRLGMVSMQDVPESERVDRPSGRGSRRPKVASELFEAFHVEDVERLKDFGVSGRRYPLVTNFFKVDRVPSYKIYNYAVFFEPECDSMLSKSKLIKSIAREHWSSAVHSFSGQSVHVAAKLPRLDYADVAWRDTRYSVRFQETGETVPGTEPFISVLGMVFRGRLNAIGFRSINRNMFDMDQSARRDIEGFDLYPGIRSSILPRESGRLLLCIDRVNKVVNRQSVSAMMSSVDLGSEYGRKRLLDDLVGNSLMTTYNNKFYRVTDIDFGSDALAEFNIDENTSITYKNYYRDRYHVEIRNPRLPLIVTRVKGKDGKKMEVKLIPELCQVAGMDKVSPGDRAKIMRALCRETIPPLRMKYVGRVLDRLTDVKEDGRHFPLEVSKRPTQVDGRRLDEPHPGTPNGAFTLQWRDIGRKTMFRVLALRRWAVLCPENGNLNRFMDALTNNMNALGLEPSRPVVETFSTRNQRNDVAEAELLLDRMNLTDLQMILVMVSNHASSRFYASLKRILSETYGIPSQFVRERNVREVKMPVIGKIGVQIASKIGCEPWTIGGGFGEPFKNTMIVGIDCHHSKSNSVAAIVCSLNPTMSKFYSRCYFQSEGQELTTSLTLCLKSAIERYARQNKRYPSSIVILRDGIGDGQLQYIGQAECHQVLQSFGMLPKRSDGSPPPKLTYIIVKKRLNARFFAEDQRGGLANPDAGIVVDTVVTMERWRDFYMIPQRVNQGTATPSHFNILADHNKFSLDQLQVLCFKLCHMYFNWAGPIRVPCVCQYAHKLAFVAGTCCKKEPKDVLFENLYYL